MNLNIITSRYTAQKLIISNLNNHSDTHPISSELTWREFVSLCRVPEPRGDMALDEYLDCLGDKERELLAKAQKNGKAIIPAKFSEPQRKKDFLLSRSLIVVDLDDGELTFDEVCEALDGLECVVHTSYSHSPKKHKIRAYVLIDQPVTGSVDDIDATCCAMLDYLQHLIKAVIDDKCWTVSQLYYLPSCPPDASHLYQWRHIAGEPLKVMDFRTKAVDKQEIRKARQSIGDRPGDNYSRNGNFREFLEELGWSFYYAGKGCDYYSRPGKSRGISGVVFHDSNVFFNHSSAPETSPFKGGEAYSLFNAYALVHHYGDYSSAAKKLKEQDRGRTEEGFPSTGECNDIDQKKRLFISATEDLLEEVRIEWLIKGVIERGTTGQIFGPSEAGKSFIAVDMGMSIATGMDWYDRACAQGQVMYFSGEGNKGLRRRTVAYHRHYPNRDLSHFHRSRTAITFNGDGVADAVTEVQNLEQQTGVPVALIVIDTLARHIQGHENDTKDMGDFVRTVDTLRDAFPGSTVIIIHHTGASAENSDRSRGSTALKAACDFEIKCADYKLKFTKMKDGEKPADIGFKLVPVQIGTDEVGEPITSCIAQYGERPAKLSKPALTKAEQIGVEALLSASIRLAITADDGTIGALVGDWKEAYFAAEPGDLDEKKKKSLGQAFKRLIGTGGKDIPSLLDKQVIRKDGEAYFLLGGECQTRIQSGISSSKIQPLVQSTELVQNQYIVPSEVGTKGTHSFRECTNVPLTCTAVKHSTLPQFKGVRKVPCSA